MKILSIIVTVMMISVSLLVMLSLVSENVKAEIPPASLTSSFDSLSGWDYFSDDTHWYIDSSQNHSANNSLRLTAMSGAYFCRQDLLVDYPITSSVWFRPDGNFYEPWNGARFGLEVAGCDDFQIYYTGSQWSIRQYPSMTLITNVSYNAWHKLEYTLNNNTSASLKVDGTSYGNYTVSADVSTQKSIILMGYYPRQGIWWDDLSVSGTGVGWEPTFTSTPITVAYMHTNYTYHVTTNSTTTCTMEYGPSWLALGGNGTSNSSWYINGTPTNIGTYAVKLKAHSGTGTGNAYQYFNITVPTWLPTFTSSPNTNTNVNHVYSYTITLNETGNVTSLVKPSWLTILNNKNGTSGPWVLNGTPTITGSYNIKLQAVSYIGLGIAYQNYTLTVNGWIANVTSSPPLFCWTNDAYSYSVTANESITVSSITKPSWVTVGGTSVSGTPTIANDYDFEIWIVSDIGTLGVSQSWTVHVADRWGTVLTDYPSPAGTINKQYQFLITTGESSTNSFTTNATGFHQSGNYIWGTPTQLGIYNCSISIQCTNGTLTSTYNWTIKVGPPQTGTIIVNEPFDSLANFTDNSQTHLITQTSVYHNNYSALSSSTLIGSWQIEQTLNQSYAYPISVSIWFKPDRNFYGLAQSYCQSLFGLGNGYNFELYYMLNGTWEIWNHLNGSAPYTQDGNSSYICNVQSGMWHHLELYYPDAFECIATIDGINYGTYHQTGNHTDKFNQYSIWALYPSGRTYFDDLTITYYPPVLPVFTSSPKLTVYNNTNYDYHVTANYADNWYFNTSAPNIIFDAMTHHIHGTPNLVGTYWVNTTITNPNGSAYQNYTLTVLPPKVVPHTPWWLFILLAVLLILVAFIKRRLKSGRID